MHYLGNVDEDIQMGICRRICDVQREDGTWALYYDGPADLSTTIECYFALKLPVTVLTTREWREPEALSQPMRY